MTDTWDIFPAHKRLSLTVHGLASGRKIHLPPLQEGDWNLTLLHYLRKEKLPVASSCNGEGICQTCRVNKNILSCQKTVGELFREGKPATERTLTVDYL